MKFKIIQLKNLTIKKSSEKSTSIQNETKNKIFKENKDKQIKSFSLSTNSENDLIDFEPEKLIIH